MKVLFVLHAPRDPRTAVFAYAAERARLLESAGHEAGIVTPVDLPAPARHPRWLPLSFPLAVHRHLSRHGRELDLVIFHSFAGWATNLLQRRRQFATVTQFHGLEPLYLERMRREHARLGRPLPLRYLFFQRAVVNRLLAGSSRRSDHVFCLNSEERRYLLEHRWARSTAISVVPNPAPDEMFEDRVYRREASRLLFLGQWLVGKGTGYLAQAFGSLASSRPGLTLLCLGTRLAEDRVRADFPPGCRGQVQVVPDADREAVAKHLAAADLFVFPTLSEGSSVALLEAMASGLPIVTTPVGAAPDHLVDGQSVLFVPPADTPALAETVGRLLDDPALAERLGRGARAAAEPLRRGDLAPAYLALLASVAAARSAIWPGPGERA